MNKVQVRSHSRTFTSHRGYEIIMPFEKATNLRASTKQIITKFLWKPWQNIIPAVITKRETFSNIICDSIEYLFPKPVVIECKHNPFPWVTRNSYQFNEGVFQKFFLAFHK